MASIEASLQDPIPVPTHGNGGSFSVLATAHINAPPSACLAAIRDTSTWSKWNTFNPSVTIDPKSPSPSPILEIGTIASVKVVMDDLKDASRDQGIVVTFIDQDISKKSAGKQGWRLAWKATGYKDWQLKSERVLEFVDDGNGGTEMAVWDTLGGAMGKMAKMTAGKEMVGSFRRFVADFKGWVEGEAVVA